MMEDETLICLVFGRSPPTALEKCCSFLATSITLFVPYLRIPTPPKVSHHADVDSERQSTPA